MAHCPRCSKRYAADTRVCWPCHAFLVPGEAPQEQPSGGEWSALQVVYLAPDELSALRVRAVLEDAGVGATVQSVQSVVMVTNQRPWGRVLVHPEDVEEAAELVNEYVQFLERTEG